MGVAVRKYTDIFIIIITFPYSTCISSFGGSSISTSLFIFNMFFRSCMLFLCNIANVAQRTFEVFQKSRYANIINYINKKVERTSTARVGPEISTCEVPRDVSRKLQLTLCVVMES